VIQKRHEGGNKVNKNAGVRWLTSQQNRDRKETKTQQKYQK